MWRSGVKFGSVVENITEWTREFAKSGVRDSLAQIVDESTPGITNRLGSDPNAFAELIAVTHLVAEEAEALLRETVLSARNAGLNWEQIGAIVGASRQAAQQRFTTGPGAGRLTSAERDPDGLPPIGTRVTISHTFTATDEIKMLNRAGAYGWHAVAFTTETWTFEFDNRQWHHAVTYGKEPNGGGWERIGRWALSVFWARPTDLPILPGNPEPEAFKSDKKLQKALNK
jgi:hypothetical protein